jgi:hypothetical protein
MASPASARPRQEERRVKQNIRPYDIAMSDELRAAVMERRRNPDGRLLPTRVERRGNTEIMAYPWADMKLGDFFFVPLRGQKPGPLSVRLRQAAARRDWELTIIQRNNGTEPSLRVCLTLLDVSDIKGKAQQYHDAKRITYSDGKWSGTRKARYRRSQGTPKLKVITMVEEPVITQPQQVEPEPVEVDATLSSDYDRGRVIRERLAALGIKP